MNACAVVWSCLGIALLHHLLTRRIVSVLTRAMRRSMDQPAHIERAMKSSGMNPTWGLMVVVSARIAEVISELRTVYHLFPLKTAARCVSGGGAVLS